MPHGRKPQPVLDRLLARIAVSEAGCWEFDGVGGDGYGQMWVGSRVDGSRRRMLTHVLSYELHVGPKPEGTELDHLCRNRACCNPEHLEPVTHKVNVERGTQGDHYRNKTHCPQGHPYDEGNTLRDKHGKRYCIACRKHRYRYGTPA